jgi:hypothetical protein
MLRLLLDQQEEGFYPRRDLRAVLKMAVGGNRCGAPKKTQSSSSPIGQIVKEVRKGVILNNGLLEVKTRGTPLQLPRVKTLFGGNMWVIRALTPIEVLSCWDVPEKIGQLLETNEQKR